MFFDDVVSGLRDYSVWVLHRAVERARADGHILDPAVTGAVDMIMAYRLLLRDEEEVEQTRNALQVLSETFNDTTERNLAAAALWVLGMYEDLERAFDAVEHLRASILANDAECDRELARRLRGWAEELEQQLEV